MPELPLAKINKCMIALFAAKHVTKRSENVSMSLSNRGMTDDSLCSLSLSLFLSVDQGIVYQLDPVRHAALLQ